MQWLYVDTNQQQVAAEEEQLGDLVQNGSIQADTLLWNETMSDWQSAQALWPDSFQAAVAAPTVARPATGGPPLIKRRGSKPAGRPASRTAKPKPGTAPSKGATTGKLTGSKAARKGRAAKPAAGQSDDEGDANAEARRFAGVLRDYNSWMVTVAVMTMILGSLSVLSGVAILVVSPHWIAAVAIVVGGVPFVAATLLLKANGSAKLAVETALAENLNASLEQLGKVLLLGRDLAAARGVVVRRDRHRRDFFAESFCSRSGFLNSARHSGPG